jgi:hypothetical protein
MSYGNQPGGPKDYGTQPPGGGYGPPSGGGYGPPPGGGYGPPGGYGAPPDPPDNHLVAAILTTLFCCLPFGIVAIVKSSQVNSKWAAGDYQGAMMASDEAKTWWKRALIIGLIVNILIVILYVVLFVVVAANVPTSTYGY